MEWIIGILLGLWDSKFSIMEAKIKSIAEEKKAIEAREAEKEKKKNEDNKVAYLAVRTSARDVVRAAGEARAIRAARAAKWSTCGICAIWAANAEAAEVAEEDAWAVVRPYTQDDLVNLQLKYKDNQEILEIIEAFKDARAARDATRYAARAARAATEEKAKESAWAAYVAYGESEMSSKAAVIAADAAILEEDKAFIKWLGYDPRKEEDVDV